MDETLFVVGTVSAAVLGLGVMGALVARSDAEVRKRAARAEKQEEQRRARNSRDWEGAFDPPRWWERGKARDQEAYFATLRRTSGGPASLHALCQVYDGQQKRRQFRRRAMAIGALVGGAVATAFVAEPTTTAKVFEVFGKPALTVATGVSLFMFGMSDRIQKAGGGVALNIFAAAVFLGALGTVLAGLGMGVWAAFKW